jgi:hypothetical protein
VCALLKLWIDNEHVLLHKAGLNQDELKYVWSVVEPRLIHHYEEAHTKRKPPLSPFESLLATLYWLRVYPTTRCIAAELNIDEKSVRNCLNHTLDALFITLVPAEFNHPTPLRTAFTSGTLAGVCAVVDSTFWVLPHTDKKEDGKKNSHYKSGTRQALKWQLLVTPAGVPWHISEVVNGSKADIMLFRESEAIDDLTLDTMVLGDKGYQGSIRVVTPKKKPKGRELTAEEKEANKEKNSARVIVLGW